MPIDPFTGQELDPFAALAAQFGLPSAQPGPAVPPPGADPGQPPAPPAAPVPPPTQPQGPPNLQIVPPPVPGKQSESTAYGATGIYNPGQFQQLGSDADKRTAGPIAAAAAETAGLAAEQSQRLGGAYDALANAGVSFDNLDADSQAEAKTLGFGPGSTLTSTDLEALGLSAKKRVLDASFAAQQKLEAMDRTAHEISVQEVRGARGRMEQQLAANRAMTVDPTLNFTAGESLGNAASLFAQGFLAAGYGIHVDVAGTLDKWTDRYVENQMTKIRQGQALAEQDKLVWDMVRSEAADEQDARDRLAMFAKDQVATALEVEAARWGAPAAQARGAEAAAKVRIEQAALANQMETGWYDRFQQQKNQIQEQALQRQGLAIQGMNARTARMAEERQAGPQGPAADIAYARKRAIVATDAEGNNRVMGVMREGYSDAQMAKVQGDVNAATRMSRDLSKVLTDLADGKPGLFSGTGSLAAALDSPEGQTYKARALRVVAQYVRDISGAQVSDQEAERYMNGILPIDAAWKRTDVTTITRNFQNDMLDNASRGAAGYMDAYYEPYLPYIAGGQANDLGAAERAANDAANRPKTETTNELDLKEALRPDAANSSIGKQDENGVGAGFAPRQAGGAVAQSRAVFAVDSLAQTARNGATAEERAQARDFLETLAYGRSTGEADATVSSPEVRALAQDRLKQLDAEGPGAPPVDPLSEFQGVDFATPGYGAGPLPGSR